MKVYLDNCMFNRPFDDQSNILVRIETEAKLNIQERIKNKELKLVWLYILDFENGQNPFLERKLAIEKWRNIASLDIEETLPIISNATQFVNHGLSAKDALHVACAIEGGADYFLSADIKPLKKLSVRNKLVALNPMSFIKMLNP